MNRKYIDLRSDTVTKPTDEMRKAMFESVVGDDVSQEDPTVNELEKLAAKFLGKESALIVPSGTFGNQLALFTHCERGAEAILSEDSHIVQHEAGAASIIAGVQLRTVQGKKDYFTWDEIEAKVRKGDDIHHPKTGLIVTQNSLGNGSVMPLNEMIKIKTEANKYNIPVHIDGARIFNASTHMKKDVKEIAACGDSIMFCLSKGLGAPIGSMLVGSGKFIDKARKKRKIMGGGMRQAGVIAAPGILAITKMTKRLEEDHEKARMLAKEFSKYDVFDINPENVHTNIFYLKFKRDKNIVSEKFFEQLKKNNILVYPPRNEGEIRFVTHLDISFEDIENVIKLIPVMVDKIV